MRSYRGQGRVLGRGLGAAAQVVRDLQHDLRALGYHDGDISGAWGVRLDAAVQAIRYDLSHPSPSPAIDAVFAAGAVPAAPATGAANVEPALAAAIAALFEDPTVRKLPSSDDPVGDNRRAWAAVRALRDGAAPTPFLAASFQAWSGGRHFRVPTVDNPDRFISVRFDHDDPASRERITSRGYGLGQYTTLNHPPSAPELSDAILDPVGNARRAFVDLRAAFDHRVVSADPAQRAADRHAELPLSPLRLCKYAPGDARFLADCHACAAAARKVDLAPGGPVHPGATLTWAANFRGVPDRGDFGCDWPYAVRRAHRDGIDSYHHQARVLGNLLYPI